MRLAKHLAHAGVASRRAAEAMIAEGRVSDRFPERHETSLVGGYERGLEGHSRDGVPVRNPDAAGEPR